MSFGYGNGNEYSFNDKNNRFSIEWDSLLILKTHVLFDLQTRA